MFKKYWPDLLVLFAGSILPLAFAPFYLSPIAFISPAVLLFCWIKATPIIALRRGFFFGLGFFSVGISWVYISIHVYGQAPVPLSVFITFIFIAYLALFFAIQGYCLKKLFPKTTSITFWLAFPCSWVLFEALRGWLFTGFPWLLLGYSQTNSLLKAFAPLFGVYGVSFITLLISSLTLQFLLFRSTSYKSYRNIFVICFLFITAYLLNYLSWTYPIGNKQKVALIQGNVAQEFKWEPDQILQSLQLYTNHTIENLNSNIIIWPEAAVTLPLHQMKSFLKGLSKLTLESNATVLTGIPIMEPHNTYNGMIAIGNGSGVYHKRHLVPFGEYIPLKPIYSFMLKAFNIPMSNSTRGAKSQSPLLANGIPIAPYICYEVAYPIEFLAFLPQAQLLVTVTDDSWFGHSIAAAQHLQMSQMRALETGRYLLFSSNTGITAAINPEGEIIKSIPTFQEDVLNVEVQPMTGTTPWMIWKTYPIALLFILLFIIRGWEKILLLFRLRKKSELGKLT